MGVELGNWFKELHYPKEGYVIDMFVDAAEAVSEVDSEDVQTALSITEFNWDPERCLLEQLDLCAVTQ